MILTRRMIFLLSSRTRRAMRHLTPACQGLAGPARAKVRASQPSPPPPSGSTGFATESFRFRAYGDVEAGPDVDRRGSIGRHGATCFSRRTRAERGTPGAGTDTVATGLPVASPISERSTSPRRKRASWSVFPTSPTPPGGHGASRPREFRRRSREENETCSECSAPRELRRPWRRPIRR